MANPELKTVPVEPTEEMLEKGAEAYSETALPEWANWDRAREVYAAMLAASPPPPVAGDEGAIKRHADWPIDPDTGLRMLLDDAAPPPPPADLKAEPVGWWRGRETFSERLQATEFEIEMEDGASRPPGDGWEPLYTKEALSAAHAAGKAEGEAGIERWNADARRLSGCLIAIHQAPDTATLAALKSVAYDAALNCISRDVAKLQIERRSEEETGRRNEQAEREADAREG